MSQNSLLGTFSNYFYSSHKTEGESSTASSRLGEDRGEQTGRAKRRDDRNAESERRGWKIRGSHKGVVEEQARQIRQLEKQLKQTEELLDSRTEELSGTQTFLSTKDRLSEEEVLDIVRDLNQNIFQVAVRLTEEWEKLEPPPATGRMEVDLTSQSHVSTLVQLVRNRGSTGLVFQLQSCLCSQAVSMTSSWGRHQELAILDSVYERLSTSEGQAISARWRSLTHSYLLQPPPHSASVVGQLANVLYETGSFSSTQQSFDFVQTVALKGIESIVRLSQSLESAFMVEVTSSDMSLLFEAPGTEFDGARMIDEFESGRQDKVVGVTEVGVRKSVCGGPGEGRRVEILLRTKVVLEKDVMGIPSDLRDQRTHAGDNQESRDHGDTKGDEETAEPELGGDEMGALEPGDDEMGNFEPGGDETGNLEPGEEIILMEDETEVSSATDHDGNMTGRVESEIYQTPAPDSEVMLSSDVRGHLAGTHSVYQIPYIRLIPMDKRTKRPAYIREFLSTRLMEMYNWLEHFVLAGQLRTQSVSSWNWTESEVPLYASQTDIDFGL